MKLFDDHIDDEEFIKDVSKIAFLDRLRNKIVKDVVRKNLQKNGERVSDNVRAWSSSDDIHSRE